MSEPDEDFEAPDDNPDGGMEASATDVEGGRLYVTATPLGNLGDLSPRARGVLAGAGLVLAEDTRRTGRLLAHLGIKPSRLASLHDHNEESRVPMVLAALAEGRAVALVSDAGTPLLSDPGYRLVAACREAGFPVSPVPGPSAPTAALSACGLPPLPHVFLGFLPRSEGDIKKIWDQYGALPASLVFFERKSRVRRSLELAFELLGDRRFCLARELTKLHEEFILGKLSDLSMLETEPRGEITVVLAPAEGRPAPVEGDEGAVSAVLEEELAIGGKPKEIARRAAARLPGWTAKTLYEKLEALRRER